MAVAAQVALAASLWRADELSDGIAWAALVAPLAAWVLAEVALLRALLRPMPAEGADVPVDEAMRTWTAHLVTAAATVLALLPLGTLLLRAGIDPDRVTERLRLPARGGCCRRVLRDRRGPRGRRVPRDLAASAAVQRPGAGGLSPASLPRQHRDHSVVFVTATHVSFTPVTASSHGAPVTQGVGAPTMSTSRALLHSAYSVAARTVFVIVS